MTKGNPVALALTHCSVHFTSRLTGWNAIKSRVDQLGLKMTDAQVKEWYVLVAASRSLVTDSSNAVRPSLRAWRI